MQANYLCASVASQMIWRTKPASPISEALEIVLIKTIFSCKLNTYSSSTETFSEIAFKKTRLVTYIHTVENV